MVLEKGKKAQVPFLYTVEFIESDIPWVTRWDNYLKASNEEQEIHWLSLFDSIMVTLSLAGMCFIILIRTVRQDILRYNHTEDMEELEADSGWKLLHGDVFRRPWGSRALAGLVGSGVQVIGACAIVILGGGIGVISPARRGSIGQALITLFTLFGIPAGYTAARLNRVFLANEVSSARSLIVTGFTAIVFPGVCFAAYLAANIVILMNGGASVPVGTVLVIGTLWFFIGVPLTTVGAYLGYRATPIEMPCRVNRLPRQVPAINQLRKPYVLAFTAGLPIISVALTEIRSLVISMVFHNFYYLIGFVVVAFCMMLIATALISVVVSYIVLLSEDWNWWWPAFWTGGSAGIYCFMTSLLIASSVSNGGISAFLVNVLYSLIGSVSLGLMLSSVSVLTSFAFIKLIFSSIKID